MFNGLKEKLNKTLSKLTEKIYSKGEGDPQVNKNEPKEKIEFLDRFKITKTLKRALGKDVALSEEDIEDVLEELELELLEADVAYDVVEKIITSLRNQLVGRKIGPKENPEEITINALKNAIKEILSQRNINIYEIIEEKKKLNEPTVIVFVGINGTGKTTEYPFSFNR